MMPFSRLLFADASGRFAVGLALALFASAAPAWGQAPAGQPAAVAPAAAPAVVQQPQVPFDLTQQPGEHPLMPFIRVAEGSLQQLDQNVGDYSCTFVKQERVQGALGERQHIFLKVLHQPFSVYMSFLQPHTGREVAFVQGQNNNELVVLEGGFKRKLLGKMHLDPQGMVAMRGQKHPITEVGIRNLTAKLIAIAKAETQFGECNVDVQPNQQIAGRPTTMVQIVHPTERKEFRANVARIFFDNQLKIPIHYDVWLWPQAAGGQPTLDGSYTYHNLKVNNGFNALDFDANNNPQIFQANGAAAANQAAANQAAGGVIGR